MLTTNPYRVTIEAERTAEEHGRASLDGWTIYKRWASMRKSARVQANDRIWISPITKQIEETTVYGEAYHGYWQEDMYSLNSRYGTASDLCDLSDALHARGMALMVDVVVNHFGSPQTVDFSKYVPFNDGSFFHAERFITNFEDQNLVETGWVGNSSVPLPDLDTENEVVIATLHQWVSNLVQTFRIDGLRLDTVKHVRKDFWPAFVQSAGVFAMGEVLSGNPKYLASYQQYTGGLLDYAAYYPLLRALSSGGNMTELMNLTAPTYRGLFTDSQLLGTFMENHDMPRFPGRISKDPAVLHNAMAYTMLSDGIPIIYYGQEQGFEGGDDPENREALWSSSYKYTALSEFLRTLNKARRIAWSAGFGSNLSRGVALETTHMVTQKGPLLLGLTNTGCQVVNKSMSFPVQFPAGTIMVDVLTSQCAVVVKSTITISFVEGAPRVFLPLSLARQMCSNIAIPPPQTSIMQKFTSIFSSSSKAAAKSAARNTLTSFDSGIKARTTSTLTVAPCSDLPTMAHPLEQPLSASPYAILRPARPSPPIQKKVPTASAMNAYMANTPANARPRAPNNQARTGTAPNVHHAKRSSGTLPNVKVPPPQASRNKSPRYGAAPPASLSQHYREERVSPRAPQQESGHALSSKYSYSASHLPMRPNGFGSGSRSNSETDLQDSYKTNGHSATQSMHSLRRKTSNQSLSAPGSRANSFTSTRPPVPPLNKIDARNALLDNNAPYAHTYSMSSASLQAPSQHPFSPHTPRSRRSSVNSNRSGFVPDDVNARHRNVSRERQMLLSQENGQPYIRPNQSEIMSNPAYGSSRTSLHHGARSRTASASSLTPDGLPLHRRVDTRAQVQMDVRQFRV